MPNFLRFPLGGDMLVNTDHIISIQPEERIAEQKDVDRASNLFSLGQTIYFVRLYLPGGCNSIDLEYSLEADRTAVYEEIVRALKATAIMPPAAKPPRKPTTRKPRE